jgi:hypothetical protein
MTITVTMVHGARAAVRAGLLVRVGLLCGLFSAPLPRVTLHPGDSYFSVSGHQQVLFARNLTSYWETDFNTILGLTKAGGGRLVRVQLDSLGDGMTSTGALDETWARRWEQVFDRASLDGIYVLPVFAGWFDWNDGTPDYGYSTWKDNPLNHANGGPATTPGELFVAGSTTQAMWLNWMQTLVRRWQGRSNIAAWEIFSEVNIASSASEQTGVAFVDRAASLIRGADARARPITASLADVQNDWPSLLRDPALDFNEIHPYPPSGQLDTTIIDEVRQKLADYGKPVLIGESGLSSAAPDGTTLDTATNADLGVKHAIWAGLVSGAMDARALYWEDSYGLDIAPLGMPYVRSYANADLAASRFASSVDISGFVPLAAQVSSGVVGAAIGKATSAIGWFRDARCEPPDWPVQPVASGQTVTLTVPGSAPRWRVDFYDTATGTTITSSSVTTRAGNGVTITLPGFSDDIAFKMTATP